MAAPLSVRSVIESLLGRQHNRNLRLKFPRDDGPSALLLPERLEADEALSQDFEYRVTLLSDDALIEAKSLLGKMVTVEQVRADGSLRFFNGYVFEFGRSGTDGGLAFYSMVLRPWMAFLRVRKNSGPLPGKTIESLTAEILQRYAFRDYRTKLGSVSDAMLTEVMQWQESDWNFLHRWWEERGWYYHYEHREDGHTLVLADNSTAADPIDGDVQVGYFTEGGPQDDDAIAKWVSHRQLAPTHYAVSSFDFKSPLRPTLSTTNTLNEQGGVPRLEVYEHTGAYGYKDTNAGDSLAKLRLEEIEAGAKHFDAQGDCTRLQPGRYFELSGHFEHDGGAVEERQFLVTEVHHVVLNNYLVDGESPKYQNQASALRKTVPWRPGRGRASAMPRIFGLHTATVVGPSDEEVDCDEYGRVLVQFHWDRTGEYDEKSYCRVRVATPMAGEDFGFVAVPRIGQEVIIQFLDGHPDRPLITGLVPNQAHFQPWTLPGNKILSGFQSREHFGANRNELLLDDTPGEPRARLATTHHTSELNLGYLTPPRQGGKGQLRGEGAELRTDASAALRAAQGLLLTTYARNQASGHQLDREELMSLLGQCSDLFKALGDYAAQHGGHPVDASGSDELVQALEQWPRDASGGNGKPVIAVAGAEGIASATAQSHVTYAGQNIDNVAQKNLQLTSGQRLSARAGQGVDLFTQAGGLSAIANQGKVLVQSQDSDVVVNAQANVQLTAHTSEIILTAPTIRLVAEDGSFVRIGGGVTIGTSAAFQVHAGSHDMQGPSTDQADRPSFGKDGTDQRFQLHYPGHTESAPRVAANQKYRITLDDGRVVEGSTDAEGRTETLTDTVMRLAKIEILDPFKL